MTVRTEETKHIKCCECFLLFIHYLSATYIFGLFKVYSYIYYLTVFIPPKLIFSTLVQHFHGIIMV